MNPYLKKIYLVPWTLWCGISFGAVTGVMFVVLFIFLNIPTTKTYRWAHHIPTWAGKIIATLWLVRVEIIYKAPLDTSKQYIFVGNHTSMLDAIVSGGYIPNIKKFIGKAEILKWPFLGYLLRKLYIPVKREDKDSRKWSMEQLFEKMKEGMSIVIFSEGTCNTTENLLKEFKDGAYVLSCATQIPILPFVIVGAKKIWNRNVWLISPGKTQLIFLPEIAANENTPEGIEKQKQAVFECIYTELMSVSL